MKFYFLTFEERKYEKYQIKFEITDLKTGRKKCWSRFVAIRDFFVEMKYYTIKNIWKEIGKLKFVIIDIAVAAILKFFLRIFFVKLQSMAVSNFMSKAFFYRDLAWSDKNTPGQIG